MSNNRCPIVDKLLVPVWQLYLAITSKHMLLHEALVVKLQSFDRVFFVITSVLRDLLHDTQPIYFAQ